ncbi:MAG: RIP metalloprotease RseP [Sphingobacteriales bacterium SCN 48-20]|uniref:RIP metalloprotease RseP n=1 Tax=Terrimonas ferruginea TaxID=249 RepID=UPI0008691FD0|nr:RIP metalloprotease RseP [Terrimonas ferruginea]MBN8783759.1 RIP metalloprotease RseP [Terrimonas ferruginea]ODT91242.1 MAG: RIP metalloprotease RseP [Sphingobacteriales bacterium SCN 48-20]OJW40806.1 MAG: RIP metalloprotease RseP [Sphingobacteriales bacterium 48-107]
MTLLAFNWSAFAANLGQFILAFSILIVLHELGHFLTAKWFGCRVEKFYLFFNPWFSLWKKKIGDTEYGLGWIPLGGYVKISGMIDESMDKEQMKLPPEPYEFRAKPAWQRLIIMLAGVIINFILALVLFAMILFVWGEERVPNKNLKYGLVADSLALSAGLRTGDLITSVNGKPVEYYNTLSKDIYFSQDPVLGVLRNGKDTTIKLPDGFLSKLNKNQMRGFVTARYMPKVGNDEKAKYINGKVQADDQLIAVNDTAVTYNDEANKILNKLQSGPVNLTFLRNGRDTVNASFTFDAKEGTGLPLFKRFYDILGYEKIEYGFFESIPAGVNMGIERLGEYIEGIRLLFVSKQHKVNENLGSVISIGKTFGGEWDWQRFWTMTALFSIILAFMNILPIPALDGGHALFTLVEMITGRKPSDKFMEYAQLVGMVLLLGLMAYAIGLDIFRLFR